MSEMKQYVILGLGIFGSTIAKTLSQYNHEVIAIDKDLACVDRVSDFVTQAIQADFTDIDQLRAIGIQDCDAAVVATGSHLEESIMGVMNLRELGIPFIMAKAKNKKYMQILQKIGADYVVRPEKEMGERVAKKLVSRNIIDLIDIDDDYSIVEIAAPAKWVGKTAESAGTADQLRHQRPGYPQESEGTSFDFPDAFYTIEANDQLLVIADNKIFKEI